LLVVFGIGSLSVPAGLSANSASAQSSMHSPSHATPRHHHRFTRFYYYGTPYYYDDSYDYAPAPVAAPPAPPKAAPVEETRRECEPKTYSVPSADGSERKVTVVRC
jgi:hypothetical protein